jgi:hypothetical protein
MVTGTPAERPRGKHRRTPAERPWDGVRYAEDGGRHRKPADEPGGDAKRLHGEVTRALAEAHADVVNAQHDAMIGEPGGELTGLRNVPGVEFEPATGESIARAMGVPYEWTQGPVADDNPSFDSWLRREMAEAFQQRAWSERTPAQRAIDVLRATPPPRLAEQAVEGLGVAGIIRDVLRENPRLDGVPGAEGWNWGYEHRRDPATRGHHDIANGRAHDWVDYPLDWPCAHGPRHQSTGRPAKNTWQGLRWIDRHKPIATYRPPPLHIEFLTWPEMKPGDVLVGSFTHGYVRIGAVDDVTAEPEIKPDAHLAFRMPREPLTISVDLAEVDPDVLSKVYGGYIEPVKPAPRSWWRRVLDLVRPRR